MPSMLEFAERQIRGEVPPPPIAQTTGLRMISIGPGRAVFELDVDRRFHNPMGTMHGGVLTLIADSAMGMAFASTLEEGQTFTTIELKANFLMPVRSGTLVATGRLVQRGRTVGLTECDVTLDGQLVARAMSTCIARTISADTRSE
ncbi:MAG: PaaI family thioesterase [Acidobacteria bacterium]|nr:PaaI family thioesterase [Acidobacteriota bacterium]